MASYIEEYDKLSRAGVGLVLTRTREPARAMNALMSYALSYELEEADGNINREPTVFAFKAWDSLNGWVSYSRPMGPGMPPIRTKEEKGAFYDDLCQIGDLSNDGINKWKAGLYVMVYGHWHISGPESILMLKEYASLFTKDDRRLVIIAADNWQPPMELVDDFTVLDYNPPTQDDLTTLASNTLERMNAGTSPYSDTQMLRIASAGLGMTSAEFEKTLSRAIVENEDTFPDTDIEDFLKIVMKAKTEVINRTEVLKLIESDDMRHVAGLKAVKSWVEDRKLCLTQEARDFGVDRMKGFLAVGVTGTGKSLLAKAISGTLSLPLIQFRLARCFGQYVGESEQRCDQALQYLESVAPCVAWLDEVDKSGFGGGASKSSDTTDRVLQQILTSMSESKAGVIWVMTANKVGNIPPEMLRPGRLDAVWGIDLPNAEGREEAFKIHIKKRGHKVKPIKDLHVAVDATVGYTPAEIESAVNSTLITCFKHGLDLSGKLLANHALKRKPYSKAFAADYELVRTWCSQYAMNADSVAEREIPEEAMVRRIRSRKR